MMETRAGFQLEVEKYLDICACGPVVEIGLVGDISLALQGVAKFLELTFSCIHVRI